MPDVTTTAFQKSAFRMPHAHRHTCSDQGQRISEASLDGCVGCTRPQVLSHDMTFISHRKTLVPHRLLPLAAAVLALSPAACGTTSSSAPTSSSTPTSTTVAATVPTSSTPPSAPPTSATRSSMRGERYCEVLVVTPIDDRVTAEVYNSWPLNECPADQWAQLDPAAIAAERGAPLALLNGPRFWLMDSVEKSDTSAMTKASFGGIEMYLQATVDVGPLADAMTPYKPHAVDRSTVFTFDAGQMVYELTSSTGETYVMQTWSQTVDPELTEADLSGLGTRLTLPTGWTFGARTLSSPLQIVTTTASAQVLQDDLKNSYSLIP
jgi:hypothetical protein